MQNIIFDIIINEQDANKLVKLGSEIDQLKAKQGQLVNENKKNTAEYHKNAASIKANTKAYNELQAAVIKENAAQKANLTTIGGINAALASEKAKLKDLVIGTKEWTATATNIRNLETKIRDVNQQLGRGRTFVGEYAKGFKQAFSQGAIMVAGVVAAFRTFTRVVMPIVKIMADFDQAMANVRAVANLTDSEFINLSDDARRLGASTKYTASEVAGLQTEFGKLGFTAQEILKSAFPTLALASATMSDLARSAEVAGGTLKGFGFDASEMQRVVDVMAKSFSSTALDMEKFANSMKYDAPVAKVANVSFEQTTAMLGVLANSMIDGSMAGTGLKKILLELSKDSRPLAERLQELADKGIDLADAEGEVGERAMTALLVLVKQIPEIKRLEELYKNAKGSAEEMAAVQLDTLQGQATIVKSAWEGLWLAVKSSNDTFDNAKKGLTGVSKALGWITESINEGDFKGYVQLWKLANPIFGITNLTMNTLRGSIMKLFGKDVQLNIESIIDLFRKERDILGESADEVERRLKLESEERKRKADAEAATKAAEEEVKRLSKAAEMKKVSDKEDAERKLRNFAFDTDLAEKSFEKKLEWDLAEQDRKWAQEEEDEKRTEQHNEFKQKQEEDHQKYLDGVRKRELDKEKEKLALMRNMIDDFALSVGETLGGAITQSDDMLKEGLKSMMIMLLNALEMQLRASKAMAFLQALSSPDSIATFGISGLLKAAIISGLITAAFQAAKSAIVAKMEGGGRIPPGHELPGYSRQGDNTLILAKPGEVVLNQAQQAAIGGAQVFRKIGVPGFASGGMVQGTQSWNMNDFINQLASKMNAQRVVLSLNDLDSAQKEVRIVRKSNGL